MDVLSVSLDVSDDGATATLRNFQQAAERTAAGANAAGKSISFGRSAAADLGSTNAAFAGIEQRIRSTSSAVDALTSRYGKLAPTIAAAREEQEKLNRSANALAILQGRAPGGTGGPLTAEQRYSRMNLGRQGADVFTSAAMGMSPAMIAIQQGPQIMEAMATSGIKLSAAMGTAALSAGLIVGAAGATYLITSQILDTEQKRLKIIEAGVIAYGKMGQLAKTAQAAYAEREAERMLQSRISQESAAELKARRDRLEAEIDRDQKDGGIRARAGFFGNEKATEEYFNRQLQQLSQLNAAIESAEAASAYAANAKFDDRWESWQRQQEAAREEQERFNKSVIEGTELAMKYGATWTAAFDGLFARANAGNPFAAFLQRSESDAEKLNKQLEGLPAHLQRAAVAMKSLADSKELFSLQLDSAVAAGNLRLDAANFRNPFDEAKNKRTQDNIIQRFLANNPNYLNLQGKTVLDDAARKDILSRTQLGRNTLESPEDRLNQRLDEQYNTIYNRNRAGFDSAVADRKFIAATQGVDPLKLSDSLRDAAATARENEAIRADNYNNEAQKFRKEQTEYQREIAEYIRSLRGKAEQGGVNAVNQKLDISVKSEDGISTRLKRFGSEDVRDQYQFSGFDLVGGSNR